MKNIFFILSIGVFFSVFPNHIKAQTLCDDETVLVSPGDDIEGIVHFERGGIQWMKASNKVTNVTTGTYQSENYILFEDGFEINNIENYFLAEITTNLCLTSAKEIVIMAKSVINYPNPFSESTTIEFSLQQATDVKIELYDAAGRFLQNIQGSTRFSEGEHQVEFNANALSPGIYLFRIIAGAETTTGRMTLIR